SGVMPRPVAAFAISTCWYSGIASALLRSAHDKLSGEGTAPHIQSESSCFICLFSLGIIRFERTHRSYRRITPARAYDRNLSNLHNRLIYNIIKKISGFESASVVTQAEKQNELPRADESDKREVTRRDDEPIAGNLARGQHHENISRRYGPIHEAGLQGSKVFATALETLTRLCQPREQTIEHVPVSDDGHAVVAYHVHHKRVEVTIR